MRFSTRILALRIPGPGAWALRFSWPTPRQIPLLTLFVLSLQPFGSLASLAIYALAVPLLSHRAFLSPRLVRNWACLGLYFGALMVFFSVAQGYNWADYALYFGYGTLLILAFGAIHRRSEALSREESFSTINWILALDLLLNAPACLIEIGQHGIGDYVTGFSGLFFSQSFSMNRANALRAGMLAVLAVANYRMQRNRLSIASATFNIAALLLSASMTTIVSFVAALGLLVFFRRFSWRSLATVSALAGLIVLADFINVTRYHTTSIFEFVMLLDSRWFPKLDIYRQYVQEMVWEYPWMPLFGNGFGNFMNRFAILLNFQHYSYFPFKEEISPLFQSALTKTHAIHYYGLEGGVVGNSIISTPWGTAITLILEWGVVGLGLGLALSWGFLKRVWRANYGFAIGSGAFLILFLAVNFFWDDYLDYPEIMIPFLLIACLLIRGEIPENRSANSGSMPVPAANLQSSTHL